MNGYSFTQRVRKVLQEAREEAFRLGHEYVGTEHVLLGILGADDGVGIAVLTNLGIDIPTLRSAVERLVPKGTNKALGPDFPYTSRAKKVLELAMVEARQLNHAYVGTEHLLLGLLHEEKGIGAQALTEVGLTLEIARIETRRVLGDEGNEDQLEAVMMYGDQRFKTAIALIELHRTRFGEYPRSLDDLQFLGPQDRAALVGLKYETLSDGYALDLVTLPGMKVGLTYPGSFWKNLGLRRTNVPRDPAA